MQVKEVLRFCFASKNKMMEGKIRNMAPAHTAATCFSGIMRKAIITAMTFTSKGMK